MAIDTRNYLKMIQDLFPRGHAWESVRNVGTELYAFSDSIKEEFHRIGQRGMDLQDETDPRTAFETLDDWDRFLALPDECSDLENRTTESRRREITAKYTGRGSISRQYYIDLALFLGFEITINEYRPFQAGQSQAGDPISNDEWIFVWQVVSPATNVFTFQAGLSQAGDPLVFYQNEVLECFINKRKPAHTIVLFAFEV